MKYITNKIMYSFFAILTIVSITLIPYSYFKSLLAFISGVTLLLVVLDLINPLWYKPLRFKVVLVILGVLIVLDFASKYITSIEEKQGYVVIAWIIVLFIQVALYLYKVISENMEVEDEMSEGHIVLALILTIAILISIQFSYSKFTSYIRSDYPIHQNAVYIGLYLLYLMAVTASVFKMNTKDNTELGSIKIEVLKNIVIVVVAVSIFRASIMFVNSLILY